jgi:hypothetical protein
MANIGAGETYHAYLVKKENVKLVDSLIKTIPTEKNVTFEYMQSFRYRFLSQTEMTFQPISAWLKGKYDGVIFSSETEISPNANDKLYFIDGILEGKSLLITRVIPQVQNGMFMISKKFPNIIELS